MIPFISLVLSISESLFQFNDKLMKLVVRSCCLIHHFPIGILLFSILMELGVFHARTWLCVCKPHVFYIHCHVRLIPDMHDECLFVSSWNWIRHCELKIFEVMEKVSGSCGFVAQNGDRPLKKSFDLNPRRCSRTSWPLWLHPRTDRRTSRTQMI